jgi:hypothetical protein
VASHQGKQRWAKRCGEVQVAGRQAGASRRRRQGRWRQAAQQRQAAARALPVSVPQQRKHLLQQLRLQRTPLRRGVALATASPR